MTQPLCQYSPRLIMMKILPALNLPMVATGSSGARVRRNPRTSMGAQIFHLQTGLLAHNRIPAVGADYEIGADLDRAIRRVA